MSLRTTTLRGTRRRPSGTRGIDGGDRGGVGDRLELGTHAQARCRLRSSVIDVGEPTGSPTIDRVNCLSCAASDDSVLVVA